MNVLITIVVLFLILRFSAKYLLPYLVKRYLNKIKNNFEQQNPSATNMDSPNKIKIKYPSRDKNEPNSSPEYTDFEEINESKTN